MVVKKKSNSRAEARKKELKKERIRYELKRRAKKQVKKQLFAILDSKDLTKETIETKKDALAQLYKNLDSKQSKGLITKGRVNRLKSRCTKKLNQLIDSSLQKDKSSELG